MSIAFGVLLFILAALLSVVSYVERLYAEMGKFLSRDFQENIESYETLVEPKLGVSRDRATNSVSVLTQLLTGTIALMIGYAVFFDGFWDTAELTGAVLLMVGVVVVFNRMLPFVYFARTKGDWLKNFTMLLRVFIYLAFPVTVVLGFVQQVTALAEPPEKEDHNGHSDAVVDALIEAGQEEGVLQESDRELIQSVVEFGEKTVRDVMTPRPEIVAVEASMTVEQFTDLLRQKPHSRVPVYEGSIDNIRGLVFAHDVLQVSDSEAGEIRVSRLLKPVNFVPEVKKVPELLREMQRENIHMAVVIDEYGSVAGIVTIEDLIEEIVGEIRDEHEAKVDIVRENESTYVLPGNLDVDLLARLFATRLDDIEATTVGGLVSEYLGHIPKRGEVVEESGLRFEVLESTDRRVEKVRVSLKKTEEQPSGLRA